MGRIVREARLETREARRRLQVRKEPYWRLIVEGVHLGYYKGNQKCYWCVRARYEKKYRYDTIGNPDDHLDADGLTIFNYAQAQEIAAKFAEKLLTGHIQEKREYAVNDAIKDYLVDFEANGKKGLVSTKAQIEAHILPSFNCKAISELKYQHINDWKNELATKPKRARSSKKTGEQKFIADDGSDPDYKRKRRETANRILTILKAILNFAYNNNKVGSNEAWAKVKPFKNVTADKPRIIPRNEITRLINACAPEFRLMVRAALMCGARYSEITRLTVSDYNSESHSIMIGINKSDRPRNIPLNNEGIEFFKQQIIGKRSDELIFTHANGTKWKKNHQIRPLQDACNAARINPPVTFKMLRHTYGSYLAMQAVSLQVIADVLGHADTRITERHYAHLMPSYVADVIKAKLPEFTKNEASNVLPISMQII